MKTTPVEELESGHYWAQMYSDKVPWEVIEIDFDNDNDGMLIDVTRTGCDRCYGVADVHAIGPRVPSPEELEALREGNDLLAMWLNAYGEEDEAAQDEIMGRAFRLLMENGYHLGGAEADEAASDYIDHLIAEGVGEEAHTPTPEEASACVPGVKPDSGATAVHYAEPGGTAACGAVLGNGAEVTEERGAVTCDGCDVRKEQDQ